MLSLRIIALIAISLSHVNGNVNHITELKRNVEEAIEVTVSKIALRQNEFLEIAKKVKEQVKKQIFEVGDNSVNEIKPALSAFVGNGFDPDVKECMDGILNEVSNLPEEYTEKSNKCIDEKSDEHKETLNETLKNVLHQENIARELENDLNNCRDLFCRKITTKQIIKEFVIILKRIGKEMNKLKGNLDAEDVTICGKENVEKMSSDLAMTLMKILSCVKMNGLDLGDMMKSMQGALN